MIDLYDGKRMVVFFVGPTGCGKSTHRHDRFAGKPCISPDDFIVGRWSFAKAASAWAHSRNLFLEMLRTKERDLILVDAQFVEAGTRREWTQMAGAFGYLTGGLIFNTPFRQILANHKKRGDRGGYGEIPYPTILKTCRSFRQQLRAGEIQKDFDEFQIVPWR